VKCTWFGTAQQRANTSIKVDGYGFTLFDSSKNISSSTTYGNPFVDPKKIRQAYTCPVDDDGDWVIIVESIPDHPGPKRRYIPRLIGEELNCNMEKELTTPPAHKSGGKVITFSNKEKTKKGTTLEMGSSVDVKQDVIPDEDPMVEGEKEDEEEDNEELEETQYQLISEGDENINDEALGTEDDQYYFSTDDEDFTEVEDNEEDNKNQGTSVLPSNISLASQLQRTGLEVNDEADEEVRGKRKLEEEEEKDVPVLVVEREDVGTSSSRPEFPRQSKRIKTYNTTLKDYVS
jgi:hypothetical protein